MRIEISKSFEKAWRKLGSKAANSVAESLDEVVNSFGRPHLHKGLGLRDLNIRGGVAYEVRVGLGLRAVFQVKEDCLYFRMIGNHDDVQAWKKNNA